MKLTRLAVALLATTTAATTVQAEGVLNIYNWGDYTNPDLIATFSGDEDNADDHQAPQKTQLQS